MNETRLHTHTHTHTHMIHRHTHDPQTHTHDPQTHTYSLTDKMITNNRVNQKLVKTRSRIDKNFHNLSQDQLGSSYIHFLSFSHLSLFLSSFFHPPPHFQTKKLITIPFFNDFYDM